MTEQPPQPDSRYLFETSPVQVPGWRPVSIGDGIAALAGQLARLGIGLDRNMRYLHALEARVRQLEEYRQAG
jgi:hypothetical protein